MLRILINSSLYFILVELHADVVVNMEDIASSSSCVYMVTLYANNIKMTMMKDEIRSKKEQARKSIISSSRRRTCINALVLPKQRKGRKNAAQFLFIMFVLILRPVSPHSPPIRIASCAQMLTQLSTRRRSE